MWGEAVLCIERIVGGLLLEASVVLAYALWDGGIQLQSAASKRLNRYIFKPLNSSKMK
jgi:hypothetical protein